MRFVTIEYSCGSWCRLRFATYSPFCLLLSWKAVLLDGNKSFCSFFFVNYNSSKSDSSRKCWRGHGWKERGLCGRDVLRLEGHGLAGREMFVDQFELNNKVLMCFHAVLIGF